MVKRRIYVEGGGNRNLDSKLRQAFANLLENYDIKKDNYNIVAGGARSETVKSLNHNPGSIILIDSENIIEDDQSKVDFLKQTIKDINSEISEDNLFFMVVCMETWIIADVSALEKFYGNNFNGDKIKNQDPTLREKKDVLDMIKNSIKECSKSSYEKSHGFEILKDVDVQKIVKSNKYAKEFFDFLKNNS